MRISTLATKPILVLSFLSPKSAVITKPWLVSMIVIRSPCLSTLFARPSAHPGVPITICLTSVKSLTTRSDVISFCACWGCFALVLRSSPPDRFGRDGSMSAAYLGGAIVAVLPVVTGVIGPEVETTLTGGFVSLVAVWNVEPKYIAIKVALAIPNQGANNVNVAAGT